LNWIAAVDIHSPNVKIASAMMDEKLPRKAMK
jgi:hypothetical protein